MTDDYAFYREQTIKLIRQDGANQARLDGHDEAIERIEKAVTDGFAAQKADMASAINHVRGEIKTVADHMDDRFEAIEADAAKTRRTLRALLIGIGVLLSLLQGAQMFVNAPIAAVAQQAAPHFLQLP